MESIKNLGANGGGFFGANGAHPFANPTPPTNFLGMLATGSLAFALAGSLSSQRRRPRSAGSLPVGSPLFGGLLFFTVVVVTGLSFLPVLVLGPVAERLSVK